MNWHPNQAVLEKRLHQHSNHLEALKLTELFCYIAVVRNKTQSSASSYYVPSWLLTLHF